tara:strand:- start:53 stop:634 length:582 start_codon:yes stop_codon:yes gene_type:complete
MRIFIAVLVLIFSLQSWTKANDITDFEIEGMSIGDSLLDYFSKSQIKDNNLDIDGNRKFHRIYNISNLEIYDAMYIFINPKDNKYIIHGIEGMIDFEKNLSACKIKKDEILESISELFKGSKKDYQVIKHSLDKTGKSKVYRNLIKINPSAEYYELELACYDWSKDMEMDGGIDHFRISLITDPVNDMYNEIQ